MGNENESQIRQQIGVCPAAPPIEIGVWYVKSTGSGLV